MDHEQRWPLVQNKGLHRVGHTFGPSNIHGGSVHLGDNYYGSGGQHFRTASTEWDAHPRLRHAASDEDHLYIVRKQSSFHFTGRRVETQLIEQFFSSSSSPTAATKHHIVVLYGLGGSGKTQVCLRYAESFRDR